MYDTSSGSCSAWRRILLAITARAGAGIRSATAISGPLWMERAGLRNSASATTTARTPEDTTTIFLCMRQEGARGVPKRGGSSDQPLGDDDAPVLVSDAEAEAAAQPLHTQVVARHLGVDATELLAAGHVDQPRQKLPAHPLPL